jgi:predicted ribosome quality control (RQC) complex YloA/Tae2 family protein
VSAKRRRLERSIREVIESSEELREKLRHYEHTAQMIARHLEKGDGVIAAARGPFRVDRRQVTEGIEEFESARHELRLALMAAGREEGASMSDVGRVLGISRQLASRLAAEVEEAHS